MSDDDYQVGYKCPPKDTQFKPGQSGNPKGRPKGTRNLASDLREELDQSLSVNEGGNVQVISKQRAMVKTLCAKALKGDLRAIQLLLNMISDLEQSKTNDDPEGALAEEDKDILDAFIKRFLSESEHSNEISS